MFKRTQKHAPRIVTNDLGTFLRGNDGWDVASLPPAKPELEHLLDAEREPFGNRAPEIPTFSPWIRRAQEHSLPTFTTHQGAYANRPR